MLYQPAGQADSLLVLIHGGGGNERDFFCSAFLNIVDHLIAERRMAPVFIIAPCFYDPDETDKSPSSSGRAVAKFPRELRERILPLVERYLGRAFDRTQRAISGFSMGGVATWHAFVQALDLFSIFLPLSGDCWIQGEKGGGSHPTETAQALAEAVLRQNSPEFLIRAITGSKDIAYPNLDPQIRAMQQLPVFLDRLTYDVLEDGVHDYATIFRYLYNALPQLFPAQRD